MWEEEVDHARAEAVSKDSRSHQRWWVKRQTGGGLCFGFSLMEALEALGGGGRQV